MVPQRQPTCQVGRAGEALADERSHDQLRRRKREDAGAGKHGRSVHARAHPRPQNGWPRHGREHTCCSSTVFFLSPDLKLSTATSSRVDASSILEVPSPEHVKIWLELADQHAE